MAATETIVPPSPPSGIGSITIADLLKMIGKSGGIAGWGAILWLILQALGVVRPGVFPPGTTPPERPPIIRPLSRLDVPNSIGRISMGNTGCTATIVGPVRDADAELTILTAAHCIKVGQTGRMKLKDGREFSFKCVSRDAGPDCAWLVAKRPDGEIPYALLALATPTKGSPVWHQGYGVDRPGNVEKGVFEGVNSASNQCQFTLSVSSGDSGGGIIHLADGAVLSPVCCTSRLSGPGRVYGATPMACHATRPKIVATSSVEPQEMTHPIIELPSEGWPAPVSDADEPEKSS